MRGGREGVGWSKKKIRLTVGRELGFSEASDNEIFLVAKNQWRL